jgi:UDP-4-amino-4,6-dideoxy-N-acetyl-beta-L-altrosamine N-acetyltransferase
VPARDFFNLRPMTEDDLRTVWAWRNSSRIRSVSFTDHEITWEEHLAWYERSKNDDSIQPMLFERGGTPTGVVTFTGIDRQTGRAEWGFYIGDQTAPKSTARIMGLLALDYAFGEVELRTLIGQSFVSNQASVRYHRQLGFRDIEGEGGRFEKGGEMLDVLRLELTAQRWRDLRPSLEQKLFPEVTS